MVKTTFFSFVINALMIRTTMAMIYTHFKCRGGLYPRSKIERYDVPDDKVKWNASYSEYKPINYTASSIFGKPWADPEVGHVNFNPKWNSVDETVNRMSHVGEYKVINGYPQNPIGRTGVSGRGVLGRWGPNHAADPVVTRWKTHDKNIVLGEDNKPILQFVAIKRGDTGEWALPGGMVDPGEKVTTTAIREFKEEAINSFEMTEDQIKQWDIKFAKFFSGGDEVYRGYVDDPRNTDNAWMETVAYNFHDEQGTVVGALKLHAGDDAVGVRWVDITPHIKLYASHEEIVREVLKRHMEQI